MHLAFLNATGLVEDAELLRERRPGRALSLAVLALEETAKIFLLADAAGLSDGKPLSWNQLEQHFKLRSHIAKQHVFAAYGSKILKRLFDADGKNVYESDVPAAIAPL